jgi:hypothetical protein
MAPTNSRETIETVTHDEVGSLGFTMRASWADGIDDSLVDLHWELRIEHWVPDDRTPLNRFRWFIWNYTGFGDPPSRPVAATADETTTVNKEALATLVDLPNRVLVSAEPHRRHDLERTGSTGQRVHS